MEIWLEQIKIHLREKTQVYEYHVCATYEEQLNEDGTMLRYRRFSCSGFVECCYREGAGITLVVEDKHLPEVGSELVDRVWGPARPLSPPAMRRLRMRMEEWGLKGPGPWRLLLPGYLLHALHRAGEEGLPYMPGPADFEF